MSPKARAAWAILLIDLAVVFVFAIWPLHESVLGVHGDWSKATSVNCGSTLKPSGSCTGVVGHRRTLLLALGGGALVLGLFGLEVVFAAKRPAQSNENGDSEPQAAPSDDATSDASAMSTELLDKLERLGRLRASGVLTDEEFAVQKANLLAGLAI